MRALRSLPLRAHGKQSGAADRGTSAVQIALADVIVHELHVRDAYDIALVFLASESCRKQSRACIPAPRNDAAMAHTVTGTVCCTAAVPSIRLADFCSWNDRANVTGVHPLSRTPVRPFASRFGAYAQSTVT